MQRWAARWCAWDPGPHAFAGATFVELALHEGPEAVCFLEPALFDRPDLKRGLIASSSSWARSSSSAKAAAKGSFEA